MNLSAIFVAIAAFSIIVSLCNALPEDPSEYAAWEEEMLVKVGDQVGKPPNEAIPQLATWVHHLSLPYHQERDGRPVFNAAKEALRAIPGHAAYFENLIKSARERIGIEDEQKPWGQRVSEYINTREQAFGMLGLVPSPEAVRVLGDFLFDEQDANAYPSDHPYEKGIGANSMLALRQIVGLPLADPPVRRPRRPNGDVAYKAEDLETWKLWYEQVKAGNRTFRFEGDPQEYSLKGPVSKVVVPREGRAAKDSLPMAEVGDGKAGLASRWPLLAAVVALALGAGAYWRMRRAS